MITAKTKDNLPIHLSDKKALLLLEYGIPHYRNFLFKYFQKSFKEFRIIHSGERFFNTNEFNSNKITNIKLFREISVGLFNIFEITKYDIIISTFNIRKPHTWLPIFFFPKKKWILWGQGLGRSRNILICFIKKKVIKLSSGYVGYTDNVRDELIEFGIDERKISVAYNTLKIDNSGITYGDDYLLYVGRIQERKGLEKVIKLLKTCDVKLLIVGEGNYLKKLKEIVDNDNLNDYVIFRKAIYDQDELKKIFANAIAYVSPDHVGLGAVHSFSYGVPIISCINRDHAPEIGYCNKYNSYLYKNDHELQYIIHEAVQNRAKRDEKRRIAYEFYKKNLYYENMINAFNYHFRKIIYETDI